MKIVSQNDIAGQLTLFDDSEPEEVKPKFEKYMREDGRIFDAYQCADKEWYVFTPEDKHGQWWDMMTASSFLNSFRRVYGKTE